MGGSCCGGILLLGGPPAKQPVAPQKPAKERSSLRQSTAVVNAEEFVETAKTGAARLAPRRQIKSQHICRTRFVIDNAGSITDQYELEKNNIGVGSYGIVRKARNKRTGQWRAAKSISKVKLKKHIDTFKREIAIMKRMDHPHIIKLFESFEDPKNIHLVMELCAGGELFDMITSSGCFTEVQAAALAQQIVKACCYMHENRFAHRDLKPENFLFKTKDSIDNNLLKIVDFGFACHFMPGVPMKTKAGTAHYVAPQVLTGSYNHLCDMWSVGVIIYVMLCGYPPFGGRNDAEVLSKVKLGKYEFAHKDWRNISEDAKNLIRSLLKYDPRQRWDAAQALNHVWLKNRAPKATRVSLQTNWVDNIRHFHSQCRLKKAALHIIAGQLNEKDIRALRDTFMALDGDGNGLLTAAEIKDGLLASGMKEPHDLHEIMEGIDSDGNGVIDYTEFLAATLDQRKYLHEDVCRTAFRLFDRDGDGRISHAELKAFMTQNDDASAECVADLLREVDRNGDGVIDFEEFMHMMRGGR